MKNKHMLYQDLRCIAGKGIMIRWFPLDPAKRY